LEIGGEHRIAECDGAKLDAMAHVHAGMTLIDASDGILMPGAYSWAIVTVSRLLRCQYIEAAHPPGFDGPRP
jgi:hypothetical protein